MGFTIATNSTSKLTQISNIFIEEYMPSANGNFVKVYITLLMASQHPSLTGELSVSTLADKMECTENDIIRALRYWQKEGLLSILENGTDIEGITLLEPGQTTDSALPTTPVSAPAKEFAPVAEIPSVKDSSQAISETAPTLDISVPDKRNYTPLQAEALVNDIEINQTITAIEKLLGSTVSPAHLQTILYFMCDIGFSSELMVTLYETAAKKGKTKPQYIEAIGISWAKKGITTKKEATDEAAAFSGRYALVTHSLGITRTLAPAERDIIDSWNSYQFADSIIAEACKRTVLQTGDTNLQYVSRILEDWHNKHVISLEDIKKCDESFKRQKQNKSEKKKNTTNSKNQFQNFPQRNYSQSDYSSLERKLLQGSKS